jgi:hypothetical protein
VDVLTEKLRLLLFIIFDEKSQPEAIEQLAFLVKIRHMLNEYYDLPLSQVDERINLVDTIKHLVTWYTSIESEKIDDQ